MKNGSGPADTRIMGVVHGALRRDLDRVRDVVTTEPLPRARQRQALGEHVVWLMTFLHAHHTSEDRGLWPLVRAKDPGAAELLDSLEADHRRIDPAATALAAAGRTYAASSDDRARTDLTAAIDALAEVLYPHLDREVADAMPVVAACLTEAEWRAVDHDHNIKPKTLRQLAMEGHWILDGIDAEGYEVVVRTVPAPMRLVVLHLLGRPYKRAARERWSSIGPRRAVAA